MSILMVNTELKRGGAAKMAATLARGLGAIGTEVVLYHCGDSVAGQPFFGLKRKGARQINALLARLGGSTWVWDRGVAEEIVKASTTAEVLHVHNLHGYYLDYVHLLEAWQDRPVVWTWHDMWGATGRCGFSFDCAEWRNSCPRCPNLHYYPAAWFDRANVEFRLKSALYARLKRLRIVAPSEWLSRIAIERGFSPEQVRVIPNPVGTDVYIPVPKATARQQLGLADNKPLVLFVAADCGDERKGYVDFLAMLEASPYLGVAVGKPPVQRSPLVHYAGVVKEPETLALYYSAADVFVLTSKADNYPNTVCEAMSCGTPVFAYAVGGVPSQMPAGWSGTVELNDVGGLRQKIDAFIDQGGRGEALSRQLRQHATNMWSLDNVVRRYLQIYHDLLA